MADVMWQEINWNQTGLIPVIAQDSKDGTVLMMAWMNREALQATIEKGEAVYFSRSRRRLWHKGETSGNTQKVVEILLDCDGDTLLLKVEQHGGIACHTGRKDCFFRRLESQQWVDIKPVLKDPEEMYSSGKD